MSIIILLLCNTKYEKTIWATHGKLGQNNPCTDYSNKAQVAVLYSHNYCRHVKTWRQTLQTINAEVLRSNTFIYITAE